MALDPTTLGRRLREARENRRLTQEQAAQAIGISRTALVHLEAGKRSLSTLEFSGLAKLYHHSVVTTSLPRMKSRRVARRTRLIIIHKLPTELINDPARSTGRSRGASANSARSVWTLRPRWACSTPSACRAYELRAPTRPFEATRQGERVAEEERRRLGLGYGPIADMADLIATPGCLGIWRSRSSGQKCRASSSAIRRYGMVILVNY